MAPPRARAEGAVVGGTCAASGADPEPDHERRRAALRLAVRGALLR